MDALPPIIAKYTLAIPPIESHYSQMVLLILDLKKKIFYLLLELFLILLIKLIISANF